MVPTDVSAATPLLPGAAPARYKQRLLGRVSWLLPASVASGALGVGFAVSSLPPMATIGALCAMATLVFPRPALILGILVECFKLPLVLILGDSSQVSIIQMGVLTLAVLRLLPYGRIARKPWPYAALVLACTLSVIAAQSVPAAQLAVGLALIWAPILAWLAGSTFGVRSLRALVGLLAVALIINSAAAALEIAAGVQPLLQAGLTYGENVRTYGGQIRVPGMMITSFHLSLAGGLGVMLGLIEFLGAGVGCRRWVAALSVLAGLSCVFLSATRIGLVLLIPMLILWLPKQLKSYRQGWRVGLMTAAVLAAISATLIARELLTASTLFDRFTLWATFDASRSWFLGEGPGTTGAVSTSSISATAVMLSDNYFISLYVQLGVLGLIAIAWVVAVLLRTAACGRAVTYAALAGVAATCLIHEAWEYSASMMALALYLGTRVAALSRESTHSAPRTPYALKLVTA